MARVSGTRRGGGRSPSIGEAAAMTPLTWQQQRRATTSLSGKHSTYNGPLQARHWQLCHVTWTIFFLRLPAKPANGQPMQVDRHGRGGSPVTVRVWRVALRGCARAPGSPARAPPRASARLVPSAGCVAGRCCASQPRHAGPLPPPAKPCLGSPGLPQCMGAVMYPTPQPLRASPSKPAVLHWCHSGSVGQQRPLSLPMDLQRRNWQRRSGHLPGCASRTSTQRYQRMGACTCEVKHEGTCASLCISLGEVPRRQMLFRWNWLEPTVTAR